MSPTTRRPRQPVTITKPHPLAWRKARALANGDVGRLRIQTDGSVLVLRP